MIRTLLWLLGGVVLGGIIHIAAILLLPMLSANSAWARVVSLDALNKPVLLGSADLGSGNPLHLDPELAYALCRIDLRQGPGLVRGPLPHAFWSVAVYGQGGTVLYSTSNRDGIGQTLDMGIFNSAQTRLLSEQQVDIAEGLLIVESREDDVIVLVRLAPPHLAMRPRYEAMLTQLSCGNLPPS